MYVTSDQQMSLAAPPQGKKERNIKVDLDSTL